MINLKGIHLNQNKYRNKIGIESIKNKGWTDEINIFYYLM